MAAEDDKLASWMDEGESPTGPPPAEPPADPPATPEGDLFVPADEPAPEAPPPPPPAPRRPGSGVRRPITGKHSARPRLSGSTRPALKKPGGSKTAKILALCILVLIPALIGVGIWRGVWTRLLREAGLIAKPVPSETPAPPVETELELAFREAGAAFAAYDAFVAGELKAFEEKHATEKPGVDELKDFLATLDRMRGEASRTIEPLARAASEAKKSEAIRRITRLPAENWQLRDRGCLSEGCYADVAVFDPATIADHATFAKPQQYATGVRHVFVNGVQVLEDGEHTGAKPGVVVRGPGWSGWD